MSKKFIKVLSALSLTVSLLFSPLFTLVGHAIETESRNRLNVSDKFSAEDELLLAKLPRAYRQRLEDLAKFKMLPEDGLASEKKLYMVQFQDKPAVISGLSEMDVKRKQENAISKIENILKTTIKSSDRLSYLVNAVSIRANESEILKIAALKEVYKVEEMRLFYPINNTAVDMTKATQIWKENHLKGERMLISIIDTGIDYTHQDIKLSDNTVLKYNQHEAEAKIAQEGLQGHWYSDKVPYGFNYADVNDQIIPKRSQHGVHVAGIAAANGGREGEHVTGVAPEAQLMAMKVFSENADGAGTLAIVKAIEDSVKFGADVINMSLGSSGGNFDKDDSYTQAIRNAVDKGVVVVVAAGNDGISSDPKGETNNILQVKDTAIVGSPSTVPQAISVAAIENDKAIGGAATYYYDNNEGVAQYSDAGSAKPVDNNRHELVYVGLGKEENYSGKNLKGKYALILRGEISFSEKGRRALEHGAEGAVVFNSKGNNTTIGMAGIGEVPMVMVSMPNDEGQKIADLLESGKKVEIKFGAKKSFANPEAGRPAGFTSWGPTPDFGFKPELAAPGGKIYSTVSGNKYEVMGGTSMASPHVAGAVALLLENFKKNKPANLAALHLSNADFIKILLENTASPLIDKEHGENLPYSPRRQGAGMIQLDKALKTGVLASYAYVGDEDKDFTKVVNGDISLKVIKNSKTFKVSLSNFSDKARSFTLETPVLMTEKTVSDRNPAIMSTVLSGASLTADKNSVTVEPAQTVDVNFTLNIPEDSPATNNWVDGFITFKSTQDAEQSDLTMPLIAFNGDWEEETVLDTPYLEGHSGILSEFWDDKVSKMKKAFTGLVFNVDFFGQSISLPLGDMSDGQLKASSIGFSPENKAMFSKVTPQLGILRTAYELSFDVLDADKNVVVELGSDKNVSKINLADYVLDRQKLYTGNAFAWNGKKWNSKFNASLHTAEEETPADMYLDLPDGQYYYRVRARMSKDSNWQETLFPVKIDTQAPTLTVTKPAEIRKNPQTAADELVFRVRLKDNEGGTGTAGSLLKITAKEETYGQKMETLVTKIPDSQDEYDVLVKNIPLDYANTLTLSVNDFAMNSSEEVEMEVGKKAGIALSDSVNGFVAGNINHVHLSIEENDVQDDNNHYVLDGKFVHILASEKRALSASTWDESEDYINENYKSITEDSRPLILNIEANDQVKRIEFTVKQKLPDDRAAVSPQAADVGTLTTSAITDDRSSWKEKTYTYSVDYSEDNNSLVLDLVRDEILSLSWKAYDENSSVIDTKDNMLFVFDTQAPTVSITESEKIKARRVMLSTIDPDTPRDADDLQLLIFFVDPDLTKYQQNIKFSDNSLTKKFPQALVSFRTGGGDGENRPADDSGEEVLEYAPVFDKMQVHTFSFTDRAGNENAFYTTELKLVDLAGFDELLAKFERGEAKAADFARYKDLIFKGYNSSSAGTSQDGDGTVIETEPTYKLTNLEDFMIINQKKANDEFEYHGTSSKISRFVMDGVEATIDADGNISGKIKLHEGSRMIGSSAYYIDEHGQEQLLRTEAYTILYDTMAPSIKLDEDLPIHNKRYFSNNDKARLKGVVEDNTFGFTFAVNGQLIEDVLDIAAKGVKTRFDKEFSVEHGDFLNLFIADKMYSDLESMKEKCPECSVEELSKHSYEESLEVISDKVAPTIKWPQELQAKNNILLSKSKLHISAVDEAHEGLKPEEEPEVKLTILLNGQEYQGEELKPSQEYTIKVIATDIAGNETVDERKVSVSDIVPTKPLKEVVIDNSGSASQDGGSNAGINKVPTGETDSTAVSMNLTADIAKSKDEVNVYFYDKSFAEVRENKARFNLNDMSFVVEKLQLPVNTKFTAAKTATSYLREAFGEFTAKPNDLGSHLQVYDMYFAVDNQKLNPQPDFRMNPITVSIDISNMDIDLTENLINVLYLEDTADGITYHQVNNVYVDRELQKVYFNAEHFSKYALFVSKIPKKVNVDDLHSIGSITISSNDTLLKSNNILHSLSAGILLKNNNSKDKVPNTSTIDNINKEAAFSFILILAALSISIGLAFVPNKK